jgi:hypothetical protein
MKHRCFNPAITKYGAAVPNGGDYDHAHRGNGAHTILWNEMAE